MKENAQHIIYCPGCGNENPWDAAVCKECGEPIPPKEHLFREFLTAHVKDSLKNRTTGKLYDVLRGWLRSHLYASIVTVTMVAAVTTGVITAANSVPGDKVPERPASIAASLLSPEEQTLFEANSSHQIFGPEEYGEVWRPAALSHTITAEKDSCYGWVVVRDMELQADGMFDGYSEIYVCPGVTVTVTGTLKAKKGFADFYVAEGGTLIVNGDIKGGANICNDGTTVVNGSYDGGRGQITCNRGSLTVTGELTGALDLFSFKGAEVSGADHTDSGIRYYDLDAADLYEGVTGMNGMFAAVGSLE